MTLTFDGYTEAVDDDAEIDGNLGLLQGCRIVYAAEVGWDSDWGGKFPSASARIKSIGPRDGAQLTRDDAVRLWGVNHVRRTETYAAERLIEQLARGEIAA